MIRIYIIIFIATPEVLSALSRGIPRLNSFENRISNSSLDNETVKLLLFAGVSEKIIGTLKSSGRGKGAHEMYITTV